jgi:hypothetical protein
MTSPLPNGRNPDAAISENTEDQRLHGT